MLKIRSSNSLIFIYLSLERSALIVPRPPVNLISTQLDPLQLVRPSVSSTCQCRPVKRISRRAVSNSIQPDEITTLLPLAELSRASKNQPNLSLLKRGFQHSSLILLTGQHPSCLACPQEICGAVPPVLLCICPPCSRLSGCRYS
jgi:hypothetical protein